MRRAWSMRGGLAAATAALALAAGVPAAAQQAMQVPDGYRIEKVVDGLNFPTGLTWDDQGRMYVAEAGGSLYPEQKRPIRILRVEQGRATPVTGDLANSGVNVALVGLTWHNGAFYITHRAADLTGAVSRVTMDGRVSKVFDGIVDSQAEHQINDIRVGPDGRMYVAVGPAGNAGVVGPSIAPWVAKSPNLHPTPCVDIVLTGRNFRTPDFRTKQDTTDMAVTGAYVPFGTETRPGQRIQGVKKCGGSILTFDPMNAEASMRTHAWGFRNLIGLAWNRQTGEMYAAENGYDIRGSRPVQDEFDASLRIREGMWYGVPDFSAGRRPLTMPQFEPPDSLQAMVIVSGQPQGKTLGFLIDHRASGLTPPDPSVLLGRHEINSSPSLLDVAPASWGAMAGHVFIAEWGDLSPPTNPLRGKKPAGYRVVRIDPATAGVEPFVWNRQPGPASMNGMQGQGLDRPFNVRFGPDGAMYIVDYGVVKIDMSLTKQGKPPYDEVPGTGVIWRVVPEGMQSPMNR
jgi:glucose/arabinose dehydrogenase